jgi:AcrR family transcriptional regulator
MTTAPQPLRSERERPPSLKERIMEAAIEEFAAAGYHGSSLRTIAERSRATKPMIYYHFQSKDGLFAAVVGYQLGLLERRIEQQLADSGDAIERLGLFARTYLRCFLFDFPGLAVGLRELPTLPSPLFTEIAAGHSRMVVAILKEIMRGGVATGDLRPHDVDNCARAVIGILHYYIRGTSVEVEEAIEAATRQVTDYYAIGLLSDAALARRQVGSV